MDYKEKLEDARKRCSELNADSSDIRYIVGINCRIIRIRMTPTRHQALDQLTELSQELGLYDEEKS